MNQDRCIVIPSYGGKEDQAFLGVFDGHGQNGEMVAQMVKEKLPPEILEIGKDDSLPKHGGKGTEVPKPADTAYYKAFSTTNKEVMKKLTTDCNFSGTTAVTALICNSMMHVANVGDSRAIMIKGAEGVPKWSAMELTSDQTCFRRDERERATKDARVPIEFLTIGMRQGEVPPSEEFGEETIEAAADPPRVFLKGHSIAGTAFTRSLGDAVAKELGVVAYPEIFSFQLDDNTKALVLCSDGVFEFLTNEQVVAIVQRFDGDPHGACEELIRQSFNTWMRVDSKTDDITAIVAYLEGAPPHENLAKMKWGKLKKNMRRPSMADLASKFKELILQKMIDEGIKRVDRDISVKTMDTSNTDWDNPESIDAALGKKIDYEGDSPEASPEDDEEPPESPEKAPESHPVEPTPQKPAEAEAPAAEEEAAAPAAEEAAAAPAEEAAAPAAEEAAPAAAEEAPAPAAE